MYRKFLDRVTRVSYCKIQKDMQKTIITFKHIENSFYQTIKHISFKFMFK